MLTVSEQISQVYQTPEPVDDEEESDEGQDNQTILWEPVPVEFVLIDIALLPEQRNAGIGAQLVAPLIQQALAAGRPLEAHVHRDNPACRLWRRLGFEIVADDGVYLQIRVSAG